MKHSILEVCADSLNAVSEAVAGGAARVELCRNLDVDGLTPDENTIKEAMFLVQQAGKPLKIMVLIRPRPGNFVYSDAEKQIMAHSIEKACSIGVHGVVIGSLNADGTIDAEWIKAMSSLAHSHGLQVTFHRAFDHVTNFAQALETLISIGVDRVLTSGGLPSAMEGAGTLSKLVSLAGNRIIIMPGAGITSENIASIRQKTAANEFHGSCRIKAHDGLPHTNRAEVSAIVKILSKS
ncbi:copper homeostasis protein CutC [uncultured Muribaculum sp.]|uniref:copper homeostasis protein CutC n=1 Tax=uncultured Muribaculum sp. TaxID=1918613 RepID=UPI0025B7A5FA|nr:copper homeostasis protein CutC [uncultured Muribaculum sp.]